jgi:predicted acetyltransferase
MNVEVLPADDSRRGTIANLMQMYLHDLSEFNGENPSRQGVFEYAYLDDYWIEPERHPFLFLAAGSLAGFALVRKLEPNVHELAEFFILRNYRRHGIGTSAAYSLFARFEGTWHVAQEHHNTPAQTFWRRVIDEFTNGEFREDWSHQSPRGPIQIFTRDAV